MLSFMKKNTCFTTNQLENTIKSITMCIAHLEQNDLQFHLVIYIYCEKSLEGSRQISGKIEVGKISIYFGFNSFRLIPNFRGFSC